DNVRISRLKAKDFCIGTGNKKKRNIVQVGKPISLTIRLPVIRISFEDDALSGDVFLQSKRTEPSDLAGRAPQAPSLSQLSFLISLLQQVPWKNRQAVEQPLSGCIRLDQLKDHGVSIKSFYDNRLVRNDQRIALRRLRLFIQVDLETKEYVIGVNRMAIRKTQCVAQVKSVLKPVGGYLPRLCQSRLCVLGKSIDVNQVTSHLGDNFAG